MRVITKREVRIADYLPWLFVVFVVCLSVFLLMLFVDVIIYVGFLFLFDGLFFVQIWFC